MKTGKIFTRDQINAFLTKNGARKLEPPHDLVSRARRAVGDAQRLVLSLWLDEPIRDGQFAALLGKAGAGYMEERLAAYGWAADEVTSANIRAAFHRESSCLVRKIFDHNQALRERLPCALAIPYWDLFARWLFVHGISQFGLTPEDVIWFLFESAEDPSLGIADTWLRAPSWQARWPKALHPEGWEAFSGGIAAWDPQFKPFESIWHLDPSHVLNKNKLKNITQVNKNGYKNGINIIGHFCYPSGLREAAMQMARAVDTAGGGTSLRDFPSSFAADLPGRGDYLGLEEWPVTALVMAPEHDLDSVYGWCGLNKDPGKIRVGVWYWELEEFPGEWISRANQYREIWAPTRFIAESMRRKLEIPVIHLPPAVELGSFEAKPRSDFGLPEGEFLFLNLFDMCSVFERKNPMAAIEAFSAAFPHGGAKLVVKVNRGEFNPSGLETLRLGLQNIGGILINETLTREETYALMACCDAYISLHRSEGFGLTMAEAMLMEKPVIATNYSGNLDFMDDNSACLIPFQMVVLDKKYHVYDKGSRWANPVLERAAQAMRWVRNQPDAARQMASLGRKRAEAVLNSCSAGERYLERAEQLQIKENLT